MGSNSTVTANQDVTFSSEAARARLQSGDLTGAASLAAARLSDHPDDFDALYILAVSQRYQKRGSEALETLERLLQVRPDYGRAYQEMGHIHRALGLLDQAIHDFERAVALNPALPASWRALVELYTARNKLRKAAIARAQLDWLSSLPPELISVTSFMSEGRVYKAERLCRDFLQRNGHHFEAMRLLAELGVRAHAMEEAEFLLESCAVLEPKFFQSRFDYVKVLNGRQKFAQALQASTELVRDAPDNPYYKLQHASQHLTVGSYDTALEILDNLLKDLPDEPAVQMQRGHALKTIGRQEDAVNAYRAAYAIRPDFGDAFWSLANLKTYRFTDAEMRQMQAQERAKFVSTPDRYHLCFALGKAFEDAADFETAFDYYERGNRLKREELSYSADRMEADLSAQIDTCTEALFSAKRGAGALAPDPIFIVGLPRAGSTLLEQILASHSQVEGTMELPNILALAHRLDGRRRVDDEAVYPANLTSLTNEELTAFGEAFIRDTAMHRKATPFFIDKMPNNFRHIGLIHLILPNAKIIDARREAMACCFSGYKQLFAEGQDFSYGLEQIGRYYRDYVRLMDHWDRVLPGKVLRVQYEDVVSDLETQVRRILAHCGLPFEEACINFHQTERAVRTASSEQVRQPIFRSGLDQWRHFSPYLGPLREALGDEVLALGGAVTDDEGT